VSLRVDLYKVQVVNITPAPAQQECFKQNIHHSLIYLLDSRLPHDNSAVWGLALDVACMIVEHKQELRPSEEYSDAPRLLRLPLAHVDATTFLDALTLVAAHLLDKKFVQGLVESMQIHLVWDLLKRTEQRMHSDREQEDDQDYDEKQYLQFQLVLSQALADMTALPLYNDKYDSEHPFIQSLYSQTLPSSSPSPIAPAACLILGNLIQSDRDAYTLIPHVPIRNLFTHISRSNDAAFLNAACGLLRHLATPMENRERYFADPTYLTSTQHLYTNISLEQVQMAGLALTRQMLASMQSRLLSAILSHDNNTNINNNDNFLTTILSSYQSTTSTSVKFEVSRLAVSFLRTLQVSSSPSSSTTTIPSEEEEDVANLPSPHQTNLTKTAQEQLFDTPVNLPSILDPLIFTIKHTPEANMMAIQAEAWLGLNLAARLSGGAIKVGDAFSRDEDLFALYCLRLGGGGGGAISNDERPNWLVEKERDNAVLLGAELIKAGDVDEGVKRKFKTVLDERGIHVGAG
jgi:hypothetical protein